jgi:hypothetical protein
MLDISFPQAAILAERRIGVFSKCRRVFEFARQEEFGDSYKGMTRPLHLPQAWCQGAG